MHRPLATTHTGTAQDTPDTPGYPRIPKKKKRRIPQDTPARLMLVSKLRASRCPSAPALNDTAPPYHNRPPLTPLRPASIASAHSMPAHPFVHRLLGSHTHAHTWPPSQHTHTHTLSLSLSPTLLSAPQYLLAEQHPYQAWTSNHTAVRPTLACTRTVLDAGGVSHGAEFTQCSVYPPSS